MTTVRQAIDALQRRDYAHLYESRLEVPEEFNWIRDVFDPLYVAEGADRVALLWTSADGAVRRFSFRDIDEEAARLVRLLRHHGLRKGDVLYAMLPVVPEVWFACLAAVRGGFVLVPAATTLTPKDLEYRFAQLPPAAVLADPGSAAKIDDAEAIRGRSEGTKLLVGGTREGWSGLEDAPGSRTDPEPARTRSDDPLLTFFTSGTTGPPKMVVHTHASYPLGHLATAAWIGVRRGDVHWNISQPGWAKFAWSCVFAPWTVGATAFACRYEGRFLAADHLRALETHRVTTFCAPPTVWRMFVLEDLAPYRFRLREVVSAGEPLSPEVIETWRAATGLTIRDGYGQTESTLMVGNLPDAEVRLGSMGRPSFLYDVTILDESGREAPPKEEGDIAVRLDPKPVGLFAKYLGSEDSKYAGVLSGTYYRTGDRAYRDDAGRFWFVGRADDVIKASDYRIGPFEVESALIEHPAVAEAAVVGRPHPIRGNLVKAFIVLRTGNEPSAELALDIFEFARKSLASFKAPKALEFVPELPKTISGKIRRVELRSREIEGKPPSPGPATEYLYEDLRPRPR